MIPDPQADLVRGRVSEVAQVCGRRAHKVVIRMRGERVGQAKRQPTPGTAEPAPDSQRGSQHDVPWPRTWQSVGHMQFVVEGLLLLSGENGDIFDGRQVRRQVPAGQPVNVIDAALYPPPPTRASQPIPHDCPFRCHTKTGIPLTR